MAKSQKERVSMKLIKRNPVLVKKEEKVQKTQKAVETPKPAKKEKMPPDTYQDIIPAKSMFIDENRTFVISVKRAGELGLPCVDIRQYQTTEAYTGYTKKGVNFPTELLPELIEMLNSVNDECEKKGV